MQHTSGVWVQWDLTSMAVSHNAALVAAGTTCACISLFDLRLAPRMRGPATAAATVAAAGDNGDAAEGDVIDDAGGTDTAAGLPKGAEVEGLKEFCAPMWGHSGPVYGLDFSWDSRLLYSCGADGTVRMWSTELHANLVAWRGHLQTVWDVRGCPAGHWIASGGADWTAKLWCALGKRPPPAVLCAASAI
jgi:WD40 repeat protein